MCYHLPCSDVFFFFSDIIKQLNSINLKPQGKNKSLKDTSKEVQVQVLRLDKRTEQLQSHRLPICVSHCMSLEHVPVAKHYYHAAHKNMNS